MTATRNQLRRLGRQAVVHEVVLEADQQGRTAVKIVGAQRPQAEA